MRKLLLRKQLYSLLVAAGLLLINLSVGYGVTNLEKTALSHLISDYNKASQCNDVAFFVQNMPQHLLDSMGLRLGRTRDELLHDMQAQLESQIKSKSAMKYSLKFDKIQYNITSSGLTYALITTVKENKRLKVESQTLAIFENAKWHLIYGGARAVQNPAFLLIYPSLEGVKFRPEIVIKNNAQ